MGKENKPIKCIHCGAWTSALMASWSWRSLLPREDKMVWIECREKFLYIDLSKGESWAEERLELF